jgi:NADPH-dependent curcumin reductase CurA
LIVLHHFDRTAEAVSELSALMRQGKLEQLETAIEGFEQLPTAINMLFDGANIGKLVLRVAN